jgi:O-antigen/teichoic acid export membrane protein
MAGTVLLLNLLAFVSEQIDIWIGEGLLPPSALGMYGVAKRSMLLTAMPVQMAMLTIIATIPRLHAQRKLSDLQALMRGAAGLAAVPSLTALALLVAFPEQALYVLFGGSYAGAAGMIRIMAVGNLVLILSGNPINILALTGRHRTVLVVNLLSASVIAIGGPLAAIWFGGYGLAGTSAAALALQNALLWWLARRQSGVWTHVGIPSLRLAKLRMGAATEPETPEKVRPSLQEPVLEPAGLMQPGCSPLPPAAVN